MCIRDRYESIAINNLGLVCYRQGDYAKAKTYYEQALRIKREIGDRQGESSTLLNLGLASANLGCYGEARRYYERSLQICREIGHRWIESFTLSSLGQLFHHLGNVDVAWEHSQQALRIAQEIGSRDLEGSTSINLGHTLAGLGRLAEAASAYQRAISLQRELGQTNQAIESLAGLARVALTQGEPTRVEEILTHLETGALDGADDPLRVYLTCYRVLVANGDPRAPQILDTAHALLQERAAKIEDEPTRRSFLENITTHREIVAEWRASRKRDFSPG